MKEESRFERGYRKLLEIDGKAGQEVENGLKDISPDLGRYIIEYSFGDIYSRDGLDLKSKEIAVVAALTALGNAQPQLKVHINGALNVGCTINEIKEVIIQMSGYSGFPTSINAMNALKDVINERKMEGMNDIVGDEPTNEILPSERYEVGVKELSELDSNQVKVLEEAYNDFAPDLVKLVVNSYADIIGRNNLSKRYRQIATIAALTALGNAKPQLKFHINSGLNIGLTIDEVNEIMLLMTVFAGFPAAINGANTLKEVVNER
ncbi:carboxymuconolactone decarboxylase family protein [Clostridium chromiireducens]|uniref:Carboxymuconolactone decarboxylase family protein n=1 Tax=Clostridium chromiireducens TaxID=225345 RepID=A0A1V4IMK2_9CLOT|nr:carboxymuconolactone decarboxylase family protein [Clostridium chromiireducens]OPJ61251.1 carboxymuconolactone decarboxylase family protein [Clostridium chromiireducens]